VSTPILELRGVTARYGVREPILRDVTLSIGSGETVGVVGMNGAGKSSLMRVISGGLTPVAGTVRFAGHELARSTTSARARSGIVQLAEGHRVIRPLTVRENLEVAVMSISGSKVRRRLAQALPAIYELFPVLQERDKQLAGLLSGGEQQMLSLARAIVQSPRLLLLDEPSLGLAPIVIERIYATLDVLRSEGLSMLIVEQNSDRVTRAASRLYVLRDGQVVDERKTDELDSRELRTSYFGSK
jgi:branched-chain amino acid transport system ATP-binding protein